MPAGLGQLDEVGLAAEDKGRGDEARAHDKAGDDARLEEVADADAGGNRAVDDEGDAGRDDDADSAGAGHEGGGEARAVAGADHAGNHDEAEGGDSGRAGAGDGGEEAGNYDADYREAAAQVADAGFGEVNEALRYLRLVHDVAGEDEVGDGQQTNLLIEELNICGIALMTVSSGRPAPWTSMAATLETPRQTAIGAPIMRSRAKLMNSTAAIISLWPPFHQRTRA